MKIIFKGVMIYDMIYMILYCQTSLKSTSNKHQHTLDAHNTIYNHKISHIIHYTPINITLQLTFI